MIDPVPGGTHMRQGVFDRGERAGEIDVESAAESVGLGSSSTPPLTTMPTL